MFEKLSRKKKHIDEYINTLNNCKLNYLDVYEDRTVIYLDDESYSDKVRLAVLGVFEEVLKQLNEDIEIL